MLCRLHSRLGCPGPHNVAMRPVPLLTGAVPTGRLAAQGDRVGLEREVPADARRQGPPACRRGCDSNRQEVRRRRHRPMHRLCLDASDRRARSRSMLVWTRPRCAAFVRSVRPPLDGSGACSLGRLRAAAAIAGRLAKPLSLGGGKPGRLRAVLILPARSDSRTGRCAGTAGSHMRPGQPSLSQPTRHATSHPRGDGGTPCQLANYAEQRAAGTESESESLASGDGPVASGQG